MRRIKNVLLATADRIGLAPSVGSRTVRETFGPDHYDQAYKQSEEYRRPYAQSRYYPIWTVISDRIRRSGVRRILEVGCGSGQLAACLLDQGVEDYVGVDFSSVAIEMARKAVPGARFLVGDARALTIYSESAYDCIVCTEVLEHIQDDLVVLSRFPPGKRCLCTVPDFPYESHVRHFLNAEEVVARYGCFFRDLDVAAIKGVTGQGIGVYFLFDGVRNEYQLPS